MSLVLNWILALVFLSAFLYVLYIVVKQAIRNGIKEAFHEIGTDVAKAVWASDQEK